MIYLLVIPIEFVKLQNSQWQISMVPMDHTNKWEPERVIEVSNLVNYRLNVLFLDDIGSLVTKTGGANPLEDYLIISKYRLYSKYRLSIVPGRGWPKFEFFKRYKRSNRSFDKHVIKGLTEAS